MFTMLNVVYDHFLTRKPPFFTVFILSRTSDTTASKNIGGDQCMGRPPHLEFWGGPSPPVRPGLRPCLLSSLDFFDDHFPQLVECSGSVCHFALCQQNRLPVSRLVQQHHSQR